jgi:tRNA(adenine34) deaminase
MYLHDEKWMKIALEEATLAALEGEVPVGAVVVRNGELISRAHNRCERDRDATAHAEMLAIREASRVLGSWRMEDCTLYVTLEPCPMCTGAVINARIGRVVFAAKDARAGAMGSLVDLTAYPLQSRPACTVGVLQDEALSLLRAFFEDLRQKMNDHMNKT